MTATITRALADEVWWVRCCTAYRADGKPHRPEADAIRSLVAHLADEHGVMVVRTLVVHDESPCPGVVSVCFAARFGLSCVRCGDTGVLTSERTVTVDPHTEEATR